MKYLSFLPSCIVIVFLPFILKYILNYKDKNLKENIIKQPKLYFYIGIASLFFYNIIIPILCILELDPSMTWYESLLFCFGLTIPFNLLGIYLILLSMNWKIIVHDSYVEYYNLFKQKRIFTYEHYQIKKQSASTRVTKKIKNKKNKYKVKTFINISSYCSNINYLLDTYDKYNEINNKKSH